MNESRRKEKLNISLDYDNTYTACPELFEGFIKAAHDLGHKVYIVTSRDEIYPVDVKSNIPILYTSGEQKDRYVSGKGITIDIWIDDAPECITIDQTEWGNKYF